MAITLVSQSPTPDPAVRSEFFSPGQGNTAITKTFNIPSGAQLLIAHIGFNAGGGESIDSVNLRTSGGTVVTLFNSDYSFFNQFGTVRVEMWMMLNPIVDATARLDANTIGGEVAGSLFATVWDGVDLDRLILMRLEDQASDGLVNMKQSDCISRVLFQAVTDVAVDTCFHNYAPSGGNQLTGTDIIIDRYKTWNPTLSGGRSGNQYVVAGAPPTTALTAPMGTGDGTFDVGSTAGWTAFGGIVKIDNEWIRYSRITVTSFTVQSSGTGNNNAERGLFGSGNVSHADSSTVEYVSSALGWGANVGTPGVVIAIRMAEGSIAPIAVASDDHEVHIEALKSIESDAHEVHVEALKGVVSEDSAVQIEALKNIRSADHEVHIIATKAVESAVHEVHIEAMKNILSAAHPVHFEATVVGEVFVSSADHDIHIEAMKTIASVDHPAHFEAMKNIVSVDHPVHVEAMKTIQSPDTTVHIEAMKEIRSADHEVHMEGIAFGVPVSQVYGEQPTGRRFKMDGSRILGNVTITFTCQLLATTGSVGAFAFLYNVTMGQEVPNSRVNTNESELTLLESSPINKATMFSGGGTGDDEFRYELGVADDRAGVSATMDTPGIRLKGAL